jgi:hypothetical protein
MNNSSYRNHPIEQKSIDDFNEYDKHIKDQLDKKLTNNNIEGLRCNMKNGKANYTLSEFNSLSYNVKGEYLHIKPASSYSHIIQSESNVSAANSEEKQSSLLRIFKNNNDNGFFLKNSYIIPYDWFFLYSK